MLVQQAHNRFDLGSWVVAVEGVAGKFVGREGGVGVGKGLSETSLRPWSWWCGPELLRGVGRHIFHRPANKSSIPGKMFRALSVN